MDKLLRSHADTIVSASIKAVQPDDAVRRALAGQHFPGRVLLVAAGKAAWKMAEVAYSCLGDQIDAGVVITKYGHVIGTRFGTVNLKNVIKIFNYRNKRVMYRIFCIVMVLQNLVSYMKHEIAIFGIKFFELLLIIRRVNHCQVGNQSEFPLE